jgi:hypothetical protein
MRGNDQQQIHVFSYISPEQRVRSDHPVRPVRTIVRSSIGVSEEALRVTVFL